MFSRLPDDASAGRAAAKGISKPSGRLEPLDGMRGVAILLVVFYHYFQRFPEYYPYGDALMRMSDRGYLGVHLFFIISGFVIALTVGKKPSISHFAIGRFVRLWPAMLVCSIITFLIIQLGDTAFAESRRVGWTGFLPSLTFTHPVLWGPIVGDTNWIDGAYWSLFVEVRFYFWIALAYLFFGTDRLLHIMVGMMVLTVPAVMIVEATAPGSQLPFLIDLVFFTEYLPLFCIGMACYQIYLGQKGPIVLGAFGLSVILAVSQCKDITEAAFVLVSAAWFLYFSLRKGGMIVNIFATRILMFFGAISYSLYLLHQNVGVFLISLLPPGLGNFAYLLCGFVVVGLVSAVAFVVLKAVERPAQGMWRSVRKAQASKAAESASMALDR